MKPFYDKMDELEGLIGMEGQGDFADEDSLPMPEGEVVADNLNPLWGPNGESLGSTYGVEEDDLSTGMETMRPPEDDMGFDPGEVGGVAPVPEGEPTESAEDLRDAFLYRLQNERDQSREFQDSNVEENKTTRAQAKKLRGV